MPFNTGTVNVAQSWKSSSKSFYSVINWRSTHFQSYLNEFVSYVMYPYEDVCMKELFFYQSQKIIKNHCTVVK